MVGTGGITVASLFADVSRRTPGKEEKGIAKNNRTTFEFVESAHRSRSPFYRKKHMRKRVVFALAVALIASFGIGSAFAQSSGNFVAKIGTAACVMDDSDGSLSGGVGEAFWTTQIKVPNGSGTALHIIPSFVTGLLTKTKLSTGDTTSAAHVGIEVCVDLDQGLINGQAAPYCVTYDKRFQQLSSNLFTTLLQDCDPVLAEIQPCELELVLSTLAAHSYNFVGHDIPGGTRTVTIDVNFLDLDATDGNEAACVGPGSVTVTQVKVFSSSDGIDID